MQSSHGPFAIPVWLKHSGFFLTLLVAFVWLPTASAVSDNQAGIGVSFHGRLKKAPCHINDDKLIEIHFKKVGINKIDGINYMQNIDYTIKCEGTDSIDKLMLSVNGNASAFDTAALQTDVSDLGIKIYQDGKALQINEPIAIDPEHHPALTAVPVQKPGAVLSARDFRVTATLLAEYQ